MNCVGGGEAFSSQAFWVWGWAYSSSVFWVRGELCQMKEWAILHTRGQGLRPPPSGEHDIASSAVVMDLHSSLCAQGLLSLLWTMTSTSEGTRIQGAALSWYMGLAATLATLQPQTKTRQRFPCKLKPCECVTQFLSGFVCVIKRRDKKLL